MGTLPQYVGPCPRCHAVGVGEWPHQPGQPCPIVVAESNAYIAKLEAERDYFLRAQMPMLDMGQAMRAITKDIGGDE